MTREEALLEILHMHNQALKQIDQWIRKNHTTQAIGSLNPMESLLLRQKSKTTQLN